MLGIRRGLVDRTSWHEKALLRAMTVNATLGGFLAKVGQSRVPSHWGVARLARIANTAHFKCEGNPNPP